MYDAASLSETQTLQRAVGELRVEVRRRDEYTVLDGLRQAGCLKARFPRSIVPGWMDVVTLNTSGGIAGGDVLAGSFHLQAGAHATIAGQAAERFYRALPDSGPASVRTRFVVAEGAAAEWLPQETILFDGCAIERRLDVQLANDASFLGIESLVFGRAAMGETVHRAWLRDAIRIRRGGRLLLNDAIRLDGDVDTLLQRPAIAGGARAMATLWFVAPDAEALLHASLPRSGRDVQCGVSAWDGMLVARILAVDGASLRSAVVAALQVLRSDRPPPRVWLC
jgi:urease accessory protein